MRWTTLLPVAFILTSSVTAAGQTLAGVPEPCVIADAYLSLVLASYGL